MMTVCSVVRAEAEPLWLLPDDWACFCACCQQLLPYSTSQLARAPRAAQCHNCSAMLKCITWSEAPRMRALTERFPLATGVAH